MAVQLNDTIEIPASGWTEVIEIEWADRGRTLNGKYYKVEFTNTNSAKEQGHDLFIQEDKAEPLKRLGQVKGSKLMLTVSDTFLNGQGKDGKNRWLVYHDKSRNIFQHRFVQGVLRKYFTLGVEAVQKMGVPEVKNIDHIIRSLTSDKLNSMEPQEK